ncbi:MAG: hypothetical protein KDB00_15955 [Planctomycetales bacterium]|nr:hypothetical protein [Planctomycetales bacterium]
MTDPINPYAAPQCDLGTPPQMPVDGGMRRINYSIALAVIVLIGSPLAAAVAVYDIESIVVSGAALSLTAIFLLVLSNRADLRSLWLISAASLLMAVGCFLTIFLKSWSPTDAQTPIGTATVVFAVVIQAGWIFVRAVWIRRVAPVGADEPTVEAEKLVGA